LPIPGGPLPNLWHRLPQVGIEMFIVPPARPAHDGHSTLHENSSRPGSTQSPLVGLELRELDLRARTGASVLAVVRAQPVLDAADSSSQPSAPGGLSPASSFQPPTSSTVVHNPDATFRFAEGDQVVLIGSREQLAAAIRLLHDPPVKARRADAGSAP